MGVGPGAGGRGEPRHGVGQNVRARQVQGVHGLGRDNQGLGRVQTAGHADDEFADPGCLKPLCQPRHLDVVHLRRAFVTFGSAAGHIRKPFDRPQQATGVVGRVPTEGHRFHARHGVAVDAGTVAKAGQPHAVLDKLPTVQIHQGCVAVVPKPFRFRQQPTVS